MSKEVNFNADPRTAHDVMDAAAVVMASIHRTIAPAERDGYVRATLRACEKLLAGVEWRRVRGGSFQFRSESQPELWHDTQRGACDCRAGVAERLCWHRPAAEMLKLLCQRERDMRRRDEKIQDELHSEVLAA